MKQRTADNQRERLKRPEVRERLREWQRTPKNKAKKAAYRYEYTRRASVKAARLAQQRTEAARAKQHAYAAQPEVKARAKAARQTEEFRLRTKEQRKGLKRLFNSSRHMAKRRGLPWSLSEEQFRALREARGIYDDAPLPTAGAGLDRVDNTRGYEPDNVVPCCTDCNLTRGDRFNYQEMLELGALIRVIKTRRTTTTTSTTVTS